MKAIQTIRFVLVVCLLFVVKMTVVNAQISFSPEKIIAHSEIVLPTIVKAADLTGNGYLDILVLSEQGKISWFKNNGENDFDKIQAIIQVVDTGSPAPTIEDYYTADLDTDGDQDLLLHRTSGIVSWLANNGSGTFGSPQNITVTGLINHVHITDLNTDGYPDLTIALTNDLVWLANNGAGNFAAQQSLVSVAPTNPTFITSTDINGDGFMDILAGNQTLPGGGESFVWYANDGAGNFGAMQLLNIPSYSSVQLHTTADLDNDGDIDIVFSYKEDENFTYPLHLAWLQNDGTGSFGSPQIINSPITWFSQPYYFPTVQVSDYNNDSNLDILYTLVYIDFEGISDANFVVSYNNGSGGFTNTSYETANCSKSGFYAADYDNNGSIDLATSIEKNDFVSVKPNGEPAIPLTYPIPANHIQYFELSDVNNDSSLDAVIFSQYDYNADDFGGTYPLGKISWIANDDSGNFLSVNSIRDYTCSFFDFGERKILCAVDFTGDGAVDYIIKDGSSGMIKMLVNNDNGNYWTETDIDEDLFDYQKAHAVDIDNDGDLDLVCHAQNGFAFIDYVYWYANDGTGVFAEPVIIFTSVSIIFFTDINNDNLPDAILGGSTFFIGLPIWVAEFRLLAID